MRSRARGFTLIELLVVIAIIALLVAILFPVLGTVYRSVQEYQCQNNMGELAKVIMAYADNYEGSFPFCGYPAGATMTTKRPSANDWMYVGNTPGQTNLDSGVLFRNRLVGTRDIFYCPADRANGLNRTKSTAIRIGMVNTNNPVCSYAINGSITYGDYYTSSQTSSTPPIFRDGQRHVRKISDFKPTDFMFIEESDDSNWDQAWFYPNSTKNMLAGDPVASPRHRGGGFVSCMDGHVEWFAHRTSDMTSNQAATSFEAYEDAAFAPNATLWYTTTGTRFNPN